MGVSHACTRFHQDNDAASRLNGRRRRRRQAIGVGHIIGFVSSHSWNSSSIAWLLYCLFCHLNRATSSSHVCSGPPTPVSFSCALHGSAALSFSCAPFFCRMLLLSRSPSGYPSELSQNGYGWSLLLAADMCISS